MLTRVPVASPRVAPHQPAGGVAGECGAADASLGGGNQPPVAWQHNSHVSMRVPVLSDKFVRFPSQSMPIHG